MVSFTKLAAILLTLHLVGANVTKISRGNVLLSRRRRYLNFPMGSNFILTLSQIKSLLQVQPRGWTMLLEVDVPFALPTDTRKLKEHAKKTKRHVVDRIKFLDQVESIFTGVGLDGETCVRKIVCTILQHENKKWKSLVRYLIHAAFIYPEDGTNLKRNFCNVSFAKCPLLLLEYILENLSLQ